MPDPKITAEGIHGHTVNVLVHQMPDRTLHVASKERYEESESYQDHEILYVLVDDGLEAYCGTCRPKPAS